MGLLDTLLGNEEGDAGAPAPAAVTATADPYSALAAAGQKAIQDLLTANTAPPKRRPVDYLLQIAAPIAQAFASAAMAPRRQAKAALITNLISGGVNTAGDIVNRKRTDAEMMRQRQIQNILLAGQIDKQQTKPEGQPFAAEQNGKRVFVQRFSDGSVRPVEGFVPPAPHVTPQAPTTADQVLPSGDTQKTVWDPTSQSYKPAMIETTGPITPRPITGELFGERQRQAAPQGTMRVPFISATKKEKPTASDKEIGDYLETNKLTDTAANREKARTAIKVRGREQKEPREGDINRGQQQDESATAFAAIQKAYKELGRDAEPQAVAKRAKQMFLELAANDDELKKHATGIHGAIDRLTKGESLSYQEQYYKKLMEDMKK